MKKRLRVNVGKSEVVRSSRYVNVGRMNVRLNLEPLEEGDCVKNLRSQVAAEEGCERDVAYPE